MDLFLSHRTLKRRRTTFPRALGEWCLDSGGFTELSKYGEWRTTENEYVDAIDRYSDELGGMLWAAPQDWMCEPDILAETGLSVPRHQWNTIESFNRLWRRHNHVIPVLQGWEPDDYRQHVAMYEYEGVDLRDWPVVGLGSVCRRNTVAGLEELLVDLTDYGLKLHGFGFKRNGLAKYAHLFESADSMAWSYAARRADPLPGCPHSACQNCLRFALQWRKKVIATSRENVMRRDPDGLTPGMVEALHVLRNGMASLSTKTQLDTPNWKRSVNGAVAKELVKRGLAREVRQWNAIEITQLGKDTVL